VHKVVESGRRSGVRKALPVRLRERGRGKRPACRPRWPQRATIPIARAFVGVKCPTEETWGSTAGSLSVWMATFWAIDRLRRLGIARHKLRRLNARPDPRIRSSGKFLKDWSWECSLSRTRSPSTKKAICGRLIRLERRQRPAGFQFNAGWQAFATRSARRVWWACTDHV